MSVFKALDSSVIILGTPTTVTEGIFSANTGSLTTFYTGSQGASSSLSAQYYTNVYNLNPLLTSSAEVQFAVAYGHRLGGGNTSLPVNNNSLLTTEATYLQYRNILLEPGETQFTFLNNYATDHIYVIDFQRQRYKEQLDPGNWQLTLNTTASGTFTFIDDSGQTFGSNFGKGGQIFNVVSGTLGGVSGSTIYSSTSSNNGGFGLVYPSLGLIVLNPDAISKTIGMVSGSYYVSGTKAFAPNSGTFETEFNQVGLVNAIENGANFTARSAETISSTYYFVTLNPTEFNYSNNPSFSDETTGAIINSDFINNPVAYITSVGLYDNNNQLLAVAKLSNPLKKTFTSLLSVQIRLDW